MANKVVDTELLLSGKAKESAKLSLGIGKTSHGTSSQEPHHLQNMDRTIENISDENTANNKKRTMTNEISVTFQIIVVVACTLCFVLSMGFGFSIGVLYAELIRVFDEDRSVVALIQSTFNTLLDVGGFLWSYPVTRLGYGYCIVIGGAIGSAAIIASSFASNVSTIIVLSGGIAGVTFGILFLGAFVIAGKISKKYNTAIIGFVPIGISVGNFTMPAIAEALLEEYNWNGALFLVGTLCLNAVPLGLIISSFEKRMIHVSIHSDAFMNRQNKHTIEKGSFNLYLLKKPVFWLLMINSFILAFTLLETRFIVDMAILKGFDRQTGSFFLTMIGVSNLIGSLVGSMSKVTCKLSSSGHMVYWMLLTTVSHLLILYLDTYAGLLGASLLHGLCVGSIYAHAGVALYEIFGKEDYAPSIAFWNIFKGIGSFLGGSLGGFFVDKTGSYDLLFGLAVGLSIYYSVTFLGIIIYGKWQTKSKYEKL